MNKKNNLNFVFFDVAFWGLLAALWFAGLWKIYDSVVENLSEMYNVEQYIIVLPSIILISIVFILARKRIRVFATQSKIVGRHKWRKK